MMNFNLGHLDLANPIDISIPLRFDGPQPNAFDVEPATAAACEYGKLIGDTRRGGSCNFEQVTLIPHCNGTHTECVGHITRKRISINECLRDILVPAVLVSVSPEPAVGSNERYTIEFVPGDALITREVLKARLSGSDWDGKALVVRTLPNSGEKLTLKYGDDHVPPFFSTEAMEFIVECGFKHLLVDLPSIDRLFDQGKLSNHRIFWNVAQTGYDIYSDSRIYNTITEIIYVPDAVEDGQYLLNLQIAPFMADASPSRPMLIKIKTA